MKSVLLLGSGDFPVPVFKKIIQSEEFKVNAIVTTPYSLEKPSKKDVSYLANKYDIPIYIPKDINADTDNILNKYKPDLILVCNYGQFLGRKLLDYPKYKCLNIHFSLLPELRGACPVEMAILSGLQKTGVSMQIMEETVDTGRLIFQKEIDIDKTDNAESLLIKLQKLAADHVNDVLKRWVGGKIEAWKQKGTVSYCFRKDISKERGKINWNTDAEDIERMIRAFNPKPVAWTILYIGNKPYRFKIYKANIGDDIEGMKVKDTYIKIDKLYIQTKRGSIMPKLVQLEGKKVMSIKSFLHGIKSKIKIR